MKCAAGESNAQTSTTAADGHTDLRRKTQFKGSDPWY